MAKERLFYTGSTRIIGDPRPSGLDMRVYACVSKHDGMSLMKGKGAGCYASNQTIAAEVGCDYTSLSKSLRRLRDWSYIIQERQPDDRRMTTYRATFPHPDSWPNNQPSDAEIVGQNDLDAEKLVGHQIGENGGNTPQTEAHYIPLKGELDSVETGEINSDESAHLNGGSLGKIKFNDNVGAQRARFEREWKARPEAFTDEQLTEWHEWLAELSADSDHSDPDNQRAQRLYYSLDAALWEANRGPYAAGEAA